MSHQLKSRRNNFLIGLKMIGALVFFVGIGTAAIFEAMRIADRSAHIIKVLYAVPIIFYPLSVYSIYYLLTAYPKWIIDREGIRISTLFKTKKYNWGEIKGIKLTGKEVHNPTLTPKEVTTIQLIDGSDVYLWAGYYHNIAAMRTVLDRANHILQDNRLFATLDFVMTRPRHCKQHVEEHDTITLKRNHLFTLNGIMLYSWIILITYGLYKQPTISLKENLDLIAFSLLITTLILGIVSYQMHYFKINKHFLIVRNSLWFWKNDIYALSDIREVVIETPTRRSTSLRVITNSFQSKLYPAGSLNKEMWESMVAHFDEHNVKVRLETTLGYFS